MIDMESIRSKIDSLVRKGIYDSEIARLLNISRQRVHQIKTGYRSPSHRIIKHPKEIKILTSKKREFLGLPVGKIFGSTGGRDSRRELVRMRDNHTCFICKKIWQQGKRAFDVHHKDEDSSKTRKIDEPNEFDNLVTLCHSCHIKLHFKKIDNPFKK